MADRVSKPLPDDALKTIFKSLPRRDLRRLALTNAQFSDVIIPMLNAKANEVGIFTNDCFGRRMSLMLLKLLRRIPPTLELYDRLSESKLAAINLLRADANRLEREYSRLCCKIHILEGRDGEWIYGFELKGKLKEIADKIENSCWDSYLPFPAYYHEEERRAITFALEYQAHQLKIEYHQMETAKPRTITTGRHALYADLLLRAEDICRELRGMMMQIVSRHKTREKHTRAREKLQAELEFLRRVEVDS